MMTSRFSLPRVAVGAAVIGWLAFGAATFMVERRPEATDVVDEPAPDERVEAQEPFRTRHGFVMELREIVSFGNYLDAIDEMADLGADSLSLVTPMFQDDSGSSRIYDDPAKAPEIEELYAVIRRAQRRGMRVTLTPEIYFADPRSNETRAKILPDDWDAWWASYRENLTPFIDLAAEMQIEAFSIGSDLATTEQMPERWTPLIKFIRDRYDGAITYSAGWDRYQKVLYWRELDFISVTGWWTITSEDQATVEQLVEGWRPMRDSLLAFAEETGRPVVISKIGYPSLPWAFVEPWRAEPEEETPVDLEAQLFAWTAFFRAWQESFDAPDFGGFFVYRWNVAEPGTADGYGYDLREKPALDVVTEWLQRLSAATDS